MNAWHAEIRMLNIKERVNIPTKLQQIRKEQRIFQESLATKVKIPLRTYQDLEYGKTKPDIYTAQRLAIALGVEIQELFPLPREAGKQANDIPE